MAVAVESVGDGNTSTSASSINWSHTIGGINRHVIVGVGYNSGSVSSVTVGAISCSLITGSNVGTGSQNVELWEPDSEPAPGANTVTVTMSGSTRLEANSINFQGVDTSSPTSGLQTNTGTSNSSGLTITTAAEDFVTDVIRCSKNPFTLPPNLQWDLSTSNTFTEASAEDGADGGTLDWTFQNSDFAHAGVNLNAAPVVRRVFVSRQDNPRF